MKILYELTITKESEFTDTDFPDIVKIPQEGKTSLVFKPVAIQTQEMYSRLVEAEEILQLAFIEDTSSNHWQLNYKEYLMRHSQ